MSNTHLRTILLLTGLLLLVACTRNPENVADVPTLAVLSDVGTQFIVVTPLPSAVLVETSPPTESPTIEAPSLTPSPQLTSTPLPSDTPSMTPTPECTAADWWDRVELIVEQFLDTAEIASKTSRISLSSIVLQMRQIQRQYEREDHPDCVNEVYRRLNQAMNEATDGFANFMAQDEIMSTVNFILATQYFWDAQQMLTKHGIFGDVRMIDTATFIWGGDSPNAATATWLVATSTSTPIAGAIAAGATVIPTQCPAGVWWEEVSPIVVEFIDAAHRAATVERYYVGAELDNLKRIQAIFEPINPPDCLYEIYYSLREGIRQTVEFFKYYMEGTFFLIPNIKDRAVMSFYNASLALAEVGVNGDSRLSNMASVWGDNSPQQIHQNETATQQLYNQSATWSALDAQAQATITSR